MAKSKFEVFLLSSVILNLLFIVNIFLGAEWSLSWSRRAASEAESVAAISCSDHGMAYLDGLVLDGDEPACECNSCYGGSDCSVVIPDCPANADSRDPLFLESFWLQYAVSGAVVVAGWHRMSYTYNDHNTISKELERHVREVHALVGNAITDKRFIIFGSGSTQVLAAAVHALAPQNSSPARVVASVPFYGLYKAQTELFESVNFKFDGDVSLWKNDSDTAAEVIEFVTSPNNPDGKLKKAVLDGPYAKSIHDHAYYWPHFTPIPAPADEDVMVFTISKLTGHAGTRLGWAVIKEEAVYERMTTFLGNNSMGVSRESQLRALKLLKTVLKGDGREIFEFGYKTMKKRWERLNNTLSVSKRFSIQKIAPQYCTFFRKVRESSAAYAWVRCEREEDKNCYGVLRAAKVNGRKGSKFGAEERYACLSLLRRQDDFDLLVQRLQELFSAEDGTKTM